MNKKNEINLISLKDSFVDISLSILFEIYKNDDYIPYSQYLRTHNWKSKRTEILVRDNYRCYKCKSFGTTYKQNTIESPFGSVIGRRLVWLFSINNLSNKKLTQKPNTQPLIPVHLQVHHKKYILNKLPWDYKNQDLVTLCSSCHLDEHKNNDIPIYNEAGNLILGYSNCNRCGGIGYLPEYNHVRGGICFKCNGERFNISVINKKP